MSLEKWVAYGWLRQEPTSPDEIRSLLGIVDRSLADAKVEAVSTDLRFIATPSTQRCPLQRSHCVPLVIALPPKRAITSKPLNHSN